MTLPLVRSTTAIPVLPGQPARPITDSGNAPAGLFLINRGDNGGDILIQPGPADRASALTLGPGGSIPWGDAAVLPYAVLPAGAAAGETLVVSSQVAGYDNPTAVAAATALQLAAQGVPNTFTASPVGTYRIPDNGSTGLVSVAPYGSLVVSVNWPQPTPVAPGAIRLRFTDPAVPDLPPIDIYLTNDNTFEASQNVWQVPIYGPALTITNVDNTANADAYVSIVGTNRTVAALRQFGDELGARNLRAETPGANLSYNLAYYTDSGYGSLSAVSRFNGKVKLQLNVGAGSGFLYAIWADATAKLQHATFAIGAGQTITDWAHPAVPVRWKAQNNATAMVYVDLMILAQ